MRPTLLVPELIWPEPGDRQALDDLACPGLEWLLARGRSRQAPPQPYEWALAGLFGLGDDAPFGALRLLGEELAGLPDARDGCWLCADPVHLRFHHERIILADASAFELPIEQARALADGLNAAFGDVGRFFVADARRWYLRLEADAAWSELPLSAVSGRRVEGELPAEPQASRLRAWLNEMQMLLHGHPVNQDRQAAGLPAVNSLWLWGAGRLGTVAPSGCDGVWSDDPLARGLARAAGLPLHARARHLDTLSGAAPLAVLDDPLAPALVEDGRGWREALERLDRDWFSPVRAALGRVSAARLLATTAYGLIDHEVSAGERFRFWRRARPLADTALALAGEEKKDSR